MAGRPTRDIDPIAREVMVLGLRRQRRLEHRASAAAVRLAAQRVGVSERTVWRWLNPEKRRSRRAFQHSDLTKTRIRMLRAVRPAFRELRADGLIGCGEKAFYRAFRKLDPAERAGLLRGRDAAVAKQHYFSFDARTRNGRWEIDDALLPIWIWSEMDKKLVRPWLTVIIDAASRTVMGFALTICDDTKAPTTESVMCALAEAILGRHYDGTFVGGLPASVGIDLGANYSNHPIYIALTRLGIEVDPAPKETPWHKAIVERLVESIKRELLPTLPGFFVPRKAA